MESQSNQEVKLVVRKLQTKCRRLIGLLGPEHPNLMKTVGKLLALCNSLGVIYLAKHNFKTARHYLNAGADILIQYDAKNVSREAVLLYNIFGYYYYLRQKFNKSLKKYYKSHSLLIENKNTRLSVSTNLLTFASLWALGESEESLRYLKAAEEHSKFMYFKKDKLTSFIVFCQAKVELVNVNDTKHTKYVINKALDKVKCKEIISLLLDFDEVHQEFNKTFEKALMNYLIEPFVSKPDLNKSHKYSKNLQSESINKIIKVSKTPKGYVKHWWDNPNIFKKHSGNRILLTKNRPLSSNVISYKPRVYSPTILNVKKQRSYKISKFSVSLNAN